MPPLLVPVIPGDEEPFCSHIFLNAHSGEGVFGSLAENSQDWSNVKIEQCEHVHFNSLFCGSRLGVCRAATSKSSGSLAARPQLRVRGLSARISSLEPWPSQRK